MKRIQVVLSYPGLGKTTFAEKDSRYVDIKSRYFYDVDYEKYIDSFERINYRGFVVKNVNPNYPNNIKSYINKCIDENKIIMMVFKQRNIELFLDMKLPFIVALPTKSKLIELEKLYLERGDDPKYVQENVTWRYNECQIMAEKLHAHVIYVKAGEHLEQALPRYFNKKVLNCFKNVAGTVLDIGAGGGMITSYLSEKKDISKVVAVDTNAENIFKNMQKITYFQQNLDNFDENVFKQQFDYVVCRDVLMYLKDINYTFSKLKNVTKKGMVLLNWYNPNHKNCHNKTTPEKIVSILENYWDVVSITYPKWYKDGYLIICRSH